MADEELELIVWFSPDGAVSGFQLTSSQDEREHCFLWTTGSGAKVARVDWGEDKTGRNRTPILVYVDEFPMEAMIKAFGSRSGCLDPEIKDLVSEKLGRYSG